MDICLAFSGDRARDSNTVPGCHRTTDPDGALGSSEDPGIHMEEATRATHIGMASSGSTAYKH